MRPSVEYIPPVPVSISVSLQGIDIATDTSIVREKIDEYSGAYSVTPSSETQVLRTANTKLDRNITVDPIPSNYGLVQWNGQFLTVS